MGEKRGPLDCHPKPTLMGPSPRGASTGGEEIVLLAAYTATQVELAYASTAHPAQGRTVDTARTLVAPTTIREALYFATTRGREANRIYVDTVYNPDPQTGHGWTAPPQTLREVLAGVLANQGFGYNEMPTHGQVSLTLTTLNVISM